MFVFQSSLRPRNPLVRLIGGVLGLFAVIGLLAIGFFAFIALIVGGAIWYLIHLLRAKRKPASPRQPRPSASDIIDGEFSVVSSDDRPAQRIEHETSGRSRGEWGVGGGESESRSRKR